MKVDVPDMDPRDWKWRFFWEKNHDEFKYNNLPQSIPMGT